jgi:hypothetical protein
VDYPFTFIRLDVNTQGEGKGTLSLATRLIVDEDDNVVEFERYTNWPIQLNNLKRVD